MGRVLTPPIRRRPEKKKPQRLDDEVRFSKALLLYAKSRSPWASLTRRNSASRGRHLLPRAKAQPPRDFLALPSLVGFVASLSRFIRCFCFCIEQLKFAQHIDYRPQVLGPCRGQLQQMLGDSDGDVRHELDGPVCLSAETVRIR